MTYLRTTFVWYLSRLYIICIVAKSTNNERNIALRGAAIRQRLALYTARLTADHEANSEVPTEFTKHSRMSPIRFGRQAIPVGAE